MKAHLPKIVIVALLVLVVGVPFALKPTRPQNNTLTAGADHTLVIFTPHNEQIRHEFSRSFNRWRIEQDLGFVQFDWRASGGTSDLRRQVLSQFEQLARRQQEDVGIGADLFFGGGEYDHNKLARGVHVPRNGQPVRISATVPMSLPSGLLDSIFPQPTIGSERLYHPDRYWIGTALSSFGIVYNRDLLSMLDLPEPKTWSDLSDTRYFGWIALADPHHSGSIAATYDAILRRLGWQEGWMVLRRIFANTRYFASSATKVPVGVSNGEAAAGMCIDFYGRFQAGAVGGQRIGYVDPAYMTATTADPISLFRGAPHRPLAEQFVVWLLSDRAQQLWQRRIDPEGEPELFELRRQPVRPDVYTARNRQSWADPDIDPFGTASPFAPGIPSFFSLIGDLTHAIAIDVHQELIAAWNAIRHTPENHPHRQQMLELFDSMPEELVIPWPDPLLKDDWLEAIETSDHPLNEAASITLANFVSQFQTRYAQDPDLRIKNRLRWTLFFRNRYRQIVKLAP